ncbi:MAG: M55 family metallopeptidase [Acidobacteriota bacterium]
MRVAHWLLTVVVLFAAALAVEGQTPRRSLKVLLLYDMEGITGADRHEKTSAAYPEAYAEGRRSLTADVNAAIAGLTAGGATEIVVVDGHGSGNGDGPDVLEDQLTPPAAMHYRSTPFDIYMDSYDHSIDAIVAIGMHAGAGNRTGFLAHTYNAHDIEYRVNGVPFNETMILAMGAARLKIPVVMVSGDDQLEREVRRSLPWARYATVKHAVNVGKAEPLPREEASRRIETAAREALQALAQMEPMEFAGPYRFALKFEEPSQAANAALFPGSEPGADTQTVQVRAHDFEDGYRQSLRLLALAGAARAAAGAQAAIARQPNAADIRRSITDWSYERWINGVPVPPPPTTPARYWGAR